MGSPDEERVTELLGRPPQGPYSIVVRTTGGDPVVIRSAPFLDDGTPMPTMYWLVGAEEVRSISRLESEGGVRQAEAEVDPDKLAEAHGRYARLRDGEIAPSHDGPRPSGGVGGTRRGLKCLHAHVAWHLAGGNDPVGAWVTARLGWDPDRYAVEGPVTPRREVAPASRGEAAPAGRTAVGPVAAIDCGTNSTRLLVAAADGTRLERLMRITRLGKGVDASGRLDAGAIDATVAVLKEFRAVMDSHGVTRARMTATSAARDAANRDVFFAAAAQAIGFEPELLSGQEEGRLSYLGAIAELDPQAGPYLVVDIGGGSTELSTAPNSPWAMRPDGLVANAGSTGVDRSGSASRREVDVTVVSMEIGCVRLTERLLMSDPPAAAELAQARSLVREWIGRAQDQAPALAGARSMVGLAGTVSALAMVSRRLSRYSRDMVHHQVLTLREITRLGSALSQKDHSARREMMGPERDRADVIVGGTLILSEIMAAFGHDECLVSEDDILDGLVMTQLAVAQ